jgi:hypothetical protein
VLKQRFGCGFLSVSRHWTGTHAFVIARAGARTARMTESRNAARVRLQIRCGYIEGGPITLWRVSNIAIAVTRDPAQFTVQTVSGLD